MLLLPLAFRTSLLPSSHRPTRETGSQRIEILEAIFTEDDVRADLNRSAFDAAGVPAVNLMGSPGSGKTAIGIRDCRRPEAGFRIGVIEGDVATDLDVAMQFFLDTIAQTNPRAHVILK